MDRRKGKGKSGSYWLIPPSKVESFKKELMKIWIHQHIYIKSATPYPDFIESLFQSPVSFPQMITPKTSFVISKEDGEKMEFDIIFENQPVEKSPNFYESDVQETNQSLTEKSATEWTGSGCDSTEFKNITNQNLTGNPLTQFTASGCELQKSEQILMEKSMSIMTGNGCDSTESKEITNQNLTEKPLTHFTGNDCELQKSEQILMEKSMSEMTGNGCESSEFIDDKTAIANQILGNEYITSDVSIENIEDSFEFMDFIDEEKMAAELFFSAQKSSFSNSFDEEADQNIPKKAKYEASANEYDKPEINFTNLVVLAVKNSPSGAVIVKDVYKFVQDNFPFYQDDVRKKDDLWKRSLR